MSNFLEYKYFSIFHYGQLNYFPMAKIELNQMTNKEKTILVFVFQKHDRF